MEGQGQFETGNQSNVPYESLANTGNVAPKGYQAIPTVESQTIVRVTNEVPAPPDYFALSLFVTICCCLPLGVVGLIKSSEVRTRARLGDQSGAEASSREAKSWSLAGLGIGLFFITIGLVINIIAIAMSSSG